MSWAKTGVINVLVRSATLLSKFALSLFLARALTPADFGFYGLICSGIAIAMILLGLEYHYFSMRELPASTPRAAAVLLRDQLVFHGLVAGGASLLLVLLAWWGVLPRAGDLPLQPLVGLLLLELAAHEVGMALLGLSRPVRANVVLFLRTGGWAFVAIPWVAWSGAEGALPRVLLCWALGAGLATAVGMWGLRHLPWRDALPAKIDWPGMGKGLRVALPYLATTLLSMGMLSLDRFLLAFLHDLTAVGAYTLYSNLAMPLHTMVNAGVALVLLPSLIRARADSRERFRREFGRFGRATLIATVLLIIPAVLLVRPVLDLIGKDVYARGIGVFHVLLGAVAIRALADVPLYGLYARRRDARILWINGLGFGLNLVLNASLIPAYSGMGAALAAAGSNLLMLALAWIAMRRPESDDVAGMNGGATTPVNARRVDSAGS